MVKQTSLSELFDGYSINCRVGSSSDRVTLSITDNQALCVHSCGSDDLVLHSGEIVVMWSSGLSRTSIIYVPSNTYQEQTLIRRLDRADPFQALTWLSQAVTEYNTY